MGDSSDRLKAFQGRLAILKHKMERGLVQRAATMRQLADSIEAGDDSARKALKSESHKLRGIAGTYGHENLTALAGILEQKASISPAEVVGKLARDLAAAAEKAGRRSVPPPAAADPIDTTAGPTETAKERTVSLRPKVASVDGQALRVLAMDDDPVTLRLLTLTLRDVGGFNATIVETAGEALKLMANEHFDVIVSDAMMPDMNGQQFYAAARESGANMPIIILSAASPAELGWTSGLSGPNAWLRKPFKPTALVHDIARIVEEHREPIA